MRRLSLLPALALAAWLLFPAGCRESTEDLYTIDLHDAGQSSVSVTPLTVVQGDALQVEVVIQNSGNSPSGAFTVEFYASTNTVISWLDHQLGWEVLSSIPAGGQVTCRLNTTDTDIPPGEYYVGWDIDVNHSVDESDEGNNENVYLASKLTVEAPPAPNLADRGSSYAGFSPATASRSTLLSVYCDVENTGNLDAGSYRVAFYASADTSITASDHLLGTVPMPALGQGLSDTCSLLSGDLSCVPAGTYYVGWIIDDQGQVPESSELDNDKAFLTYTLLVTQDAVGWIGGGFDGWTTASAPASGSGFRSFHEPSGVCVDGSGNLYVADAENHRVCKWDASGNALGWIGSGLTGWQTTGTAAAGSGLSSFSYPYAVFVDGSGDIYVADSGNHRVSKWSAAGSALGWIGGGLDGWQAGSAPAAATDYQSFDGPLGVCVDGFGCVYVSDTGNHRVSKWDASGNALGWIGGAADGWQTGTAPAFGTDYRSFDTPWGLCLDSQRNLYVADAYNARVCLWGGDGTAVGWIGGGTDGWQTGSAPPTGTDHRSFHTPSDVHVDAAGTIFVSDSGASCLFRWSAQGTGLGFLGGGLDDWQTGSTTALAGTDYRSFTSPGALCGDGTGGLYVADTLNHRISQW